MLSFCTTVCHPLTAQIDDHTPICISVFLIFHLPRDHMYRGFKKNNNNDNNNKTVIVKIVIMVGIIVIHVVVFWGNAKWLFNICES